MHKPLAQARLERRTAAVAIGIVAFSSMKHGFFRTYRDRKPLAAAGAVAHAYVSCGRTSWRTMRASGKSNETRSAAYARRVYAKVTYTVAVCKLAAKQLPFRGSHSRLIADGGTWDSRRMTSGSGFAFTFQTNESFPSHCSLHQKWSHGRRPLDCLTRVAGGGCPPPALTGPDLWASHPALRDVGVGGTQST